MTRAWHFLPDDGRLRFGDRQKVIVGETLKVDPEKLAMCEFGFHASERAIDALKYAPGSLVCRVELSGRILYGDGKMVASERTVLSMADATDTLHRFACKCAEDALQVSGFDDARSLNAIDMKLKWLDGLATDEEFAAAWDAANDAARDAARDARDASDAAWAARDASDAAWAANDAARDAARDARDAARAARDAAWDARDAARAARDAAWDARDAAWAAACAAVWDARDAAWDAARAARAAAWDSQNIRLTEMLERLLSVGGVA